MLLRVPAPSRLRAGLWAPWQLPWWRSASYTLECLAWLLQVLLVVLAVLLLPLLVGWLLFG